MNWKRQLDFDTEFNAARDRTLHELYRLADDTQTVGIVFGSTFALLLIVALVVSLRSGARCVNAILAAIPSFWMMLFYIMQYGTHASVLPKVRIVTLAFYGFGNAFTLTATARMLRAMEETSDGQGKTQGRTSCILSVLDRAVPFLWFIMCIAEGASYQGLQWNLWSANHFPFIVARTPAVWGEFVVELLALKYIAFRVLFTASRVPSWRIFLVALSGVILARMLTSVTCLSLVNSNTVITISALRTAFAFNIAVGITSYIWLAMVLNATHPVRSCFKACAKPSQVVPVSGPPASSFVTPTGIAKPKDPFGDDATLAGSDEDATKDKKDVEA